MSSQSFDDRSFELSLLVVINELLELYLEDLSGYLAEIGISRLSDLSLDFSAFASKVKAQAASPGAGSLRLFTGEDGNAEGFCTLDTVTIPQANGAQVLVVDNIFVQSQATSEEQAELLERHLRLVVSEYADKVDSMSFCCFSSDGPKKEVFQKLGAEPFCFFRVLPIEAAQSLAPEDGTVQLLNRSGAADASLAEQFAAIIFEYRLRRTDFDPLRWPEPAKDHLRNHAHYLLSELLGKSDIPSGVVEENGELIGAGIARPIKARLNISSSIPLACSSDIRFLELDDFCIRYDKSWESYAPTLLSEMLAELQDSSITHLMFVQNCLDRESIEFSVQLGAEPVFEFYNLIL